MDNDTKKTDTTAAGQSWPRQVGALLRHLYAEQRKRPHTWAGRAIAAAEKLARRIGL